MCRAKREFLESKLKDVEGQLQESKADRAASGRERKMAEALAHMQRTMPGGGPAWQKQLFAKLHRSTSQVSPSTWPR